MHIGSTSGDIATTTTTVSNANTGKLQTKIMTSLILIATTLLLFKMWLENFPHVFIRVAFFSVSVTVGAFIRLVIDWDPAYAEATDKADQLKQDIWSDVSGLNLLAQ